METIITGFGHADAATALGRICIGLFFAISGFHKLFNPGRRATMQKTLTDLGIPFVPVMRWFVSGTEFAAGTCIALGLLTVPAAFALLCICVVACSTDGLARVRAWKPINRADWLDTWLYLPETLYAVLIVIVILNGVDRYSLDYWLELWRFIRI